MSPKFLVWATELKVVGVTEIETQRELLQVGAGEASGAEEISSRMKALSLRCPWGGGKAGPPTSSPVSSLAFSLYHEPDLKLTTHEYSHIRAKLVVQP